MCFLPPALLPALGSSRNAGRRGGPASARGSADTQPVAAAQENRERAGDFFVLWNVFFLDLA
jgi:hypothetical protein